MTVHHLIRWIIEPTDATIIRCIFHELNQSQHVSGSRLQSNNSSQKVHTAYTTAPHNHSQHNQASSHEVLTSLVLVLLMMGIMMPETCWDWFNSWNIHLIIVASVGSIIHLVYIGREESKFNNSRKFKGNMFLQ
jgi:glycerol uptake facilitator-like aquaporin